MYSAHATKVPGLIFLSGQVPTDITGQVVPGGIQEHTVGGFIEFLDGMFIASAQSGQMHKKSGERLRGCGLLLGKGGQSERLLERYG